MTKEIIIVALIVALIYLYYQNKKLKQLPATTQTIFEINDEHSTSIFDKDEEEDKENLIAEKDSAIRAKNEAEAENLSLSNKLKLKQQEVSRKETEIERLKKEKSQAEISLNAKLKEWKEKYSKQGKLLDTEQLECKKLEEKVEQLEAEVKKLKGNLPGSFPEDK